MQKANQILIKDGNKTIYQNKNKIITNKDILIQFKKKNKNMMIT